jgi:iron complex outermembrane receptor protein
MFLLVLPAVPAEDAAGIAGRVVDRSGDPVAGASVTISCDALDGPLVVRSDESGRFQSPPIPAGPCSLEASLGGLDVSARARRSVEGGRVEQVDLMLDLDVIREQVTVHAVPGGDGLESREIRESFARDVGEALARLQGVQKVRRGGLASDVVVRGFRGDNVNVLIDGHRVYGACPNRMDPPAFHVDFAEIERVEVAKGAFDTMHAGSLGGIVNIVTREPEPGAHARLQAVVGSFGYVAPSMSGSFSAGPAAFGAGYSLRRGDPYDDGDGREFTEFAGYAPAVEGKAAFDVQTAWASAGIQMRPGHRLDVRATAQRGDLQLYPYLLMDAEYDDADRVTVDYRADRPATWIEWLEAGVAYAGVKHDMTDRLRTSGQGKPRGYSMETYARSEVVDEKVRIATRGGFTWGIDAYQRKWDARTMLAGRSYAPQYSIPDVDVSALGASMQYARTWRGTWKLDAGARVDHTSTRTDPGLANTDLYEAFHGTSATSSDDATPSVTAAVTWMSGGPWEVFGGAGRTARAPDPVERYFALIRPDSAWVGNPALTSPRNTEVDVGARYRGRSWSLDLQGFHSAVHDAVAVVGRTLPGSGARARTYENNDATLVGGEAAVRWTSGSRFYVAAGLSYVRGTQDVNAALGILDSDLPETPPFEGRASFRYDTGTWFAEAEGVATDGQERVNEDLLEERTAGWGVVNLRGGVVLGRVSVFAGVDNVLDRAYREHFSYQRDPFRSGAVVPEPGRSFSVSAQLRY